MTDGQNPKWVWISSEASRAAGQVSVLAVAETLICVGLYWLLILYWGVTWHHWMIVIATPMVLMRSEASVAKGVRWFDKFPARASDKEQSSSLDVQMVTAAAAAGICGYLVAENWLAERTGTALFWRAAATGWLAVNTGLSILFAVAGKLGAKSLNRAVCIIVLVAFSATIAGAAVAGGPGAGALAATAVLSFLAVAAAAALVAVGIVLSTAGAGNRGTPKRDASAQVIAGAVSFAIPGVLLAMWFRAVGTRVAATACHPLSGLIALPANWRHLVIHSDLLDPPELVPGHVETCYGQIVSLSRRASNGEGKEIGLYMVEVTLVLILYTPTLLWRWAIKSTAWFYLPLLWIGRGWQNLDTENLLIWAKSYSAKWLNRIGLTLSVLFLATSLFALILPSEFLRLAATLKIENAPMTPVGYLLVLDWSLLAQRPWQWFYLPSWLLTLAMFFMLDAHAKEIAHGAAPEARTGKLRLWMWVGNARTVLTNIGLAVALIYFLRAVDAPARVAAFWHRLF